MAALSKQSIAIIHQHLTPLLGEKIYAARLQWGSMLAIDFGAPLKGNEWRGQWGLRIEQAIWHLQMGEKGIVAADDPRDMITESLQYLLGEALTAVTIKAPAFATTLTFSNQFVMPLFPIFSRYSKHLHNWILYTPDNYELIVGCGTFWSYKQMPD